MSMRSALFLGHIWHKRYQPKPHAFRYRGFYFLLDLDELQTLNRRLRLFSLNRFNLFSFFETDHNDGFGFLRLRIEDRMKKLDPDWQGGRILLLAVPRLAGYVFNPLSVYYCYDHTNRLKAILYEVNNTFGERHIYPFLVTEEKPGRTRLHQCDKEFYVSPFSAVDGIYRFGNRLDDSTLNLTIDYRNAEGERLLGASIAAEKRRLTDRALFRVFLFFPLQTIKVILGIHFEALRLWLKGIPLVKRPQTGKSPPEDSPKNPIAPENVSL